MFGPQKSAGLIRIFFSPQDHMPASTCGTSCGHRLTLKLVPAACPSGRRQDYQQEKAVGGEFVSGLLDQHGRQHTECISDISFLRRIYREQKQRTVTYLADASEI